MKKIIFSKSRLSYSTTYSSYTDYLSLIQLAGFEQCSINEIDLDQDAIYIITPPNWETNYLWGKKPSDFKATLVVWALERSYPEIYLQEEMPHDFFGYAELLLVSDQSLCQRYSKYRRTRFMPLGSHPQLGSTEKLQKHWDYTHLSYTDPVRRKHIYSQLDKSLKCPDKRGGIWGVERDIALKRTTCMVNVHQDNLPIIEPLRFALCAAYAMPMITEECADPSPYESGKDIVSLPYDDLIKGVRKFLQRPNMEMGQKMWQKMCVDLEFGKVVRQTLQEEGLL